MRIVALVPARGGSKGIKGKNVRHFCGRPLLEWAVDVGMNTCDQTYVTTEDPFVAVVAADAGASVILRPESLAEDDTPMLSVVTHAIMDIEADIIVLLQPTQPLRTVRHVHEALALLDKTHADSVVSVVQVPAHYSPDYVMRINSEGCLEAFLRWTDAMPTRRQACREAYSRDGTVYAMKRETIEAGSLYGEESLPLVIPANESVNIDTEEDWQRAEELKELQNG